MKTLPCLPYFDYMGGGTDCQKKALLECGIRNAEKNRGIYPSVLFLRNLRINCFKQKRLDFPSSPLVRIKENSGGGFHWIRK